MSKGRFFTDWRAQTHGSRGHLSRDLGNPKDEHQNLAERQCSLGLLWHLILMMMEPGHSQQHMEDGLVSDPDGLLRIINQTFVVVL